MSDATRSLPSRLRVSNFAQIDEVDLKFGDLTVLVGAQGTGKTLVLEWLKTAIDGRQLAARLKDAGYVLKDVETAIDLVFGIGMGKGWSEDTVIKLDSRTIDPAQLARLGSKSESVFFIPAQRSMLISDGWAQPFQRLSEEVPVVARVFSQTLYDLFGERGDGVLFPVAKRFKAAIRKQIDEAVFHSGTVSMEERNHRKRLTLSHGDMDLPYMTWTAGQREFTPLLLGLYHLLPGTRQTKRPDIDWVVIEEPEMGLHPQAISVVVLLVLELLWRGYRVVLSTHSPHLLTAVWMLRQLQQNDAHWQLVCDGLGVPTDSLREVAGSALTKDYRVHALGFGDDGKVRSRDISALDPDSDDEVVAGWGGITGYSSRLTDAVIDAVNRNAA